MASPYRKCSFMLDSGATDSFINSRFVAENDIVTEQVPPDRSVHVKLADGSDYTISQQVKRRIFIGNYAITWTFMVLPLEGYDTILGLDWLDFHNPHVNWQQRTVKFDFQSKRHILRSIYRPDHTVDDLFYDDSDEYGILSADSFYKLLVLDKHTSVNIVKG